jgi:ABC-type Fe3+ transport system substrate-binding protein
VISASKGAPVKWLKFEPSVEAFNVISLVKNGPHPNAGKLLVDYLLSEEGQKVLKAVGYLPAHPRVEAEEPSIKPEYGQFNAVVFSPDDINQLPRWTSIYRDLFR